MVLECLRLVGQDTKGFSNGIHSLIPMSKAFLFKSLLMVRELRLTNMLGIYSFTVIHYLQGYIYDSARPNSGELFCSDS